MDIRVGRRMRHKRLGQMVTILHCTDTQDPMTLERHYACMVVADDGRQYYASERDLDESVEQGSFLTDSEQS